MNPLVATAIALLLALVLVAVLVRRHLPEIGLLRWLRESFAAASPRAELAAMREESARLAEPSAETGDIRVGDLLEDMSEPGQAYHQPVDLREVVGTRRSH